MRAAQVKASLSVNRELMLLYWHVGRQIQRAQEAEGWGTKVVERLARDLAAEFPEMGGFSPLNLKRMLAFHAAWAPVEIVQQAVSKLDDSIVSRAVTQLENGPPEPLAMLPQPAGDAAGERRSRPGPARAVATAQGRW